MGNASGSADRGRVTVVGRMGETNVGEFSDLRQAMCRFKAGVARGGQARGGMRCHEATAEGHLRLQKLGGGRSPHAAAAVPWPGPRTAWIAGLR